MSKSVFNTTVNSVFAVYTPKYYDTLLSVQMALDSLCDIPDDFWPTRQDLPEDAQDPQLLYILSVFQDPLLAVQNSLFATFNINGFSSIGSDFSGESYELDEQVAETNWTKFNLFTYAYVAAGLTLILLNTLFIISRTPHGWTPFNYFRKAFNFLAGIGLCLVALVTLDDDKAAVYQGTPWPLPVLLLAFFFVLVLNHLPHPPPLFFGGSAAASGKVSAWGVIKGMGFRRG